MHTDPAHSDGQPHHKPRHLAERTENLLGMIMVVAIVLLALGLAWTIMSGSVDSTPTWMR
jgi:hypothetical protein